MARQQTLEALAILSGTTLPLFVLAAADQVQRRRPNSTSSANKPQAEPAAPPPPHAEGALEIKAELRAD